MGKIGYYYNTLKYLKLLQLVYLVINRFKSKRRISNFQVPKYKIPHIVIPSLDNDYKWLERFNIEGALSGKIRLLNEDIELNYSESYLSTLKPLLRNNVLYMEYAAAMGAMYKQKKESNYAKCFLELYNDFLSKSCKPGSYIYSLHIPNILIALNLFEGCFREEEINKIMSELYIQYRYIKTHQEKHLLANHYLENLKALIIGSLIFGEIKETNTYLNLFKKELNTQINDDGMHFELSPMYHKIILEDLLRVYVVLHSFGISDTDWLRSLIIKMSNAALVLEDGFNRTLLFNDSGDNVSKPLSSIIEASVKICGFSPDKTLKLESSGYYRLQNDEINVIFDGGNPGPSYQPGHVHNDCLSYELAYRGVPIFVNCGTLLYQGNQRQFFRSTKGHNTVMAEGVEQSECWGEHRVARRGKIISVQEVQNEIIAEMRDYKGNLFVRRISLVNRRFSVLDKTPNQRGVKIYSYLHIPLDFPIKIEKNQIEVGNLAVISLVNCKMEIHKNCDYAPEFGKKLKCNLIEFSWMADNQSHGYITQFNPFKL